MAADSSHPPIAYLPAAPAWMRRVAISASLLLVLAAIVASLFVLRSVDNQLTELSNAYECGARRVS